MADASWERAPRPRWRSPWWRVPAAVLALLAVTWSLRGSGDLPSPAPAPSPGEATASEPAPPPPLAAPAQRRTAAGAWRELPAPPVPWRHNPMAVWTGREVLVWGRADTGMVGAALDPAADAWRQLPPAPLADGDHPVTAWVPRTGSAAGGELIVWGGTSDEDPWAVDGAAYDPVADAWRVIAAGPLRGRLAPAWAVLPLGLLVVGGTIDRGPPLRDGALYRPEDDAWEPVPPLPGNLPRVVRLVWTGEEVLAFLEPAEPSADALVLGWRPGDLAWRSHQAAPVAGSRVLAGVAFDGTVAVWPGRDGATGPARLLLFDTAARVWTSVAAPTERAARPSMTWLDGRLALIGASGPDFLDADLFDPVTGRWEHLGTPDSTGTLVGRPDPVWTEQELILLGMLASWRPER